MRAGEGAGLQFIGGDGTEVKGERGDNCVAVKGGRSIERMPLRMWGLSVLQDEGRLQGAGRVRGMGRWDRGSGEVWRPRSW